MAKRRPARGPHHRVLGRPDDFGIDVEILIRSHHIPHQFPEDVSEQARAIPGPIPPDEIAKRRDFREYDIVTIDGETARDFDDAVWVDRLPTATGRCTYISPTSAITSARHAHRSRGSAARHQRVFS